MSALGRWGSGLEKRPEPPPLDPASRHLDAGDRKPPPLDPAASPHRRHGRRGRGHAIRRERPQRYGYRVAGKIGGEDGDASGPGQRTRWSSPSLAGQVVSQWVGAGPGWLQVTSTWAPSRHTPSRPGAAASADRRRGTDRRPRRLGQPRLLELGLDRAGTGEPVARGHLPLAGGRGAEDDRGRVGLGLADDGEGGRHVAEGVVGRGGDLRAVGSAEGELGRGSRPVDGDAGFGTPAGMVMSAGAGTTRAPGGTDAVWARTTR
jgi:hypothetical protein